MGMACGQARARIAASRTAAVAIAFLFDFACVMIAATSRLFPHGSCPCRAYSPLTNTTALHSEERVSVREPLRSDSLKFVASPPTVIVPS